jgi:hypothetical protein
MRLDGWNAAVEGGFQRPSRCFQRLLKAMNRGRQDSGKLAFNPTLQRDSVQRYWSFGEIGCLQVSLVLVDRSRLAPGCALLSAAHPRFWSAGSKVILSETACKLLELPQHGLFGNTGSNTVPPATPPLLDGLWWIKSDYLPLSLKTFLL